MRLPKFECLSPCTLAEACSLLAAHGGEARVLAGGTDLLVALKQRRVLPRYLINLKAICDLGLIAYDAAGLSLGALATLDDIANSGVVREFYPLLAEAAGRVASPQIRNVGTIGGNVVLDSRCWYYNQSAFWRATRPPCYKAGGDVCYVVKGGKQCYSLIAADTVPALIALDAVVELVSVRGVRVVPVGGLYTGVGQRPHAIEADEIISRVIVPPPVRRGVYLKHAYRGAIDFPLVGVAVTLALDGGDVVKDVRLVVGAATPAPVRVVKAEAVMVGQALREELLAEVAEVAVKEVIPIVHIYAPVAYKRRMVEVLVRRGIKQAAEQAKEGMR